MNESHDFGWALKRLGLGARVARAGWNGRNMWLTLITAWSANDPKESHPRAILGNLPFIAMRTAKSELVPWLASQTDMLSSDWYEVE
jgi:hypothetical protein